MDAGTNVSVDLCWPGVGRVRCEGSVVRGSVVGRGRSVVAIAFSRSGDDIDALIADLSAAQGALASEVTTVFYSPRGDLRSHHTRLVGADAVTARSCLEVIWRFEGAGSQGALVFDASPASLEMARFVRDEFPHVRRVLAILDDDLDDGQRAHELGLCDEIVRIDASVALLAAALGVLEPCLSCGEDVHDDDLPFCHECRDRSRQSLLTELDELGIAG